MEIIKRDYSSLSGDEIQKLLYSYEMTGDYHTHTIFSHGKGNIEDNVKVGIEKGLEEIAISDHGPGHLSYGVKRKNFAVMREEIERLKKIYPQIKIYLSVEANITNSGNHTDIRDEELKFFDFVIAGYHYGIINGYCISNWLYNRGWAPEFVGKRQLIKNTDMTVEAIYKNDLKILTHPGDKGRFDIEAISKACADRGTLMEISTWHKNLTVEEIKTSSKYDVKYVISSDAHTSDRVGSFRPGLARALKAGLDIDRIVNIRKKREEEVLL